MVTLPHPGQGPVNSSVALLLSLGGFDTDRTLRLESRMRTIISKLIANSEPRGMLSDLFEQITRHGVDLLSRWNGPPFLSILAESIQAKMRSSHATTRVSGGSKRSSFVSQWLH